MHAPKRFHCRSATAVFVHGLFSGPAAWDPLIRLFEKDPVIGQAFHLKTFQYSSPKFELRPWRRIPTFRDIASMLDAWLQQHQQLDSTSRWCLVGHSQGGLVIQQYISMLFETGRIEEIRKLRAVILLATPNTGSELFLSLRRSLDRIWYHPQERQLRPYDEEMDRVRRTVLLRAVLAPAPSTNAHPIRFFSFAGESDGVVSRKSAHWVFSRAENLPGDHSSILAPVDTKDLRFQALRSALCWVRHSFPPDGLLIQTEALDMGSSEDIKALAPLTTLSLEPSQATRNSDIIFWLTNYQEQWELRLSVLVAKVNGAVSGFLMFHESEELILVDHIAVRAPIELSRLEQSQFSGVLVHKMIERLRNRSRDLGVPVVFEVRDPSSSKRRKDRARVRYFERLGARQIVALPYVAPDAEKLADGDQMTFGNEVPHILMYARNGAFPENLSRAQIERLLELIYCTWYKNWYSHRTNSKQLETYLQRLLERVKSQLTQHAFPVVRG